MSEDQIKETGVEESEKQPVFTVAVNCKAHWKELHSKYVPATALYVGKVKVVEYYYNGTRPKGDPKVYKVVADISSLKSDLGSFETEEECRARCIQAAKVFCNQLEVIPDENAGK